MLAAATPAMALAIDPAPPRDLSRPELSEQRFVSALERATGDDALILRTQIARTYGVRKEFDKARDVLRQVEPGVPAPAAKVRRVITSNWAEHSPRRRIWRRC
jgi:hypothetical protein